jgi:hypothetical protein
MRRDRADRALIRVIRVLLSSAGTLFNAVSFVSFSMFSLRRFGVGAERVELGFLEGFFSFPRGGFVGFFLVQIYNFIHVCAAFGVCLFTLQQSPAHAMHSFLAGMFLHSPFAVIG